MTVRGPRRAIRDSGKLLLGSSDRGHGGLMMHLGGNALRRAWGESGSCCELCIAQRARPRGTARQRHGQAHCT